MYSQNEPDIAILPLSDSSIILGNPIYRKTFTHFDGDTEPSPVSPFILHSHDRDPSSKTSPYGIKQLLL